MSRLHPLFPLLLLSACDGAADSATPAATVVDSAGVQIVTSTDPAWAPGEEWRISAAPILEIGMAEGPNEYLLSRVGDARRRGDGSVLVANGQTAEIRVFDPEGRFIHSIGRRGDGPGEFNAIFWFSLLPGDTVVGYDLRGRRLSLFGRDGEFVRSTTLDATEQGFPPMVVGMFGDRSLLSTFGDFGVLPHEEGEVVRSPVQYLRIAAGGELLDTVTVQPGAETYMETGSTPEGMTIVMMNIPLFGRTTVAALVGDRLVLGTNDSYELQVLTPDGRLERLIRRLAEPRAVSEAMVEAARAARIAESRDEADRQRQEQALSDAPHAATVPFYEEIVGDDEGNLWVQEFTVPGEPAPGWSVYDPEGRLLGSVQLPERFRPMHIGADFVLGVAQDDLDVERVQMYALEKGGA